MTSPIIDFIEARLEEDDEDCDGANEYSNCDRFSARRRRDVEAKRRIVTEHEGVHRCDWGEHRGGDLGPCSTLLSLVAAYSDDPNFDPNWSTT